MNEKRKAKIEEWKAKGADWCATELWSARKMLKDCVSNFDHLQRRVLENETRTFKTWKVVDEANKE